MHRHIYITYLIGVYLILLHWQIWLKTSESESAIWQNTLIFMMQSCAITSSVNLSCFNDILTEKQDKDTTIRIFCNYKSLFIMFQYIWGYLTLTTVQLASIEIWFSSCEMDGHSSLNERQAHNLPMILHLSAVFWPSRRRWCIWTLNKVTSQAQTLHFQSSRAGISLHNLRETHDDNQCNYENSVAQLLTHTIIQFRYQIM